jgi:DNA repair protein RadC
MDSSIQNIFTKTKPDIRELTMEHGIKFPSNEELIMLILGKGTKYNPVSKISQKVIEEIEKSNSENLIQNLLKIPGVGQSKALSIAAALELGRRKNSFLKTRISKPSDVIPYIKQYALKPIEHFLTITTNGAQELLNIKVISVGNSNMAYINMRDVFCDALKEHASGIICCHNHPCGPCCPSEADIKCTQALKEASGILGISFLDHIIITTETYFSFLEHNLLNDNEV